MLAVETFPRGDLCHLLLEAGAGFGKSTMMKAAMKRLADDGVFVPAYLSADVLASFSDPLTALEQQVNVLYRVALDWTTLCQQGRAALLVDGLDEISDQDRTRVVVQIEQFTARFPNVGIMVAARDRSALTLPQHFVQGRIQRLTSDEQAVFLAAYLALRPEISADKVQRALRRSEDLSALCSIPLFLALLVATLPRAGTLPTGRSDLLERYVDLVLSPQRHKAGARMRMSTTPLRRCAEALALEALKNNELTLTDMEARRCLTAIDPSRCDDCLEDLLQSGLIVRRGLKIGFPIATVQEYLAGVALASGEPDVEGWFGQIARRPWAQATQFAIERASGIDAKLLALLKREDDVFHTSLRVIARSVASGARAAPELRDQLAERLIAAWQEGSGWHFQMEASDILTNGLIDRPSTGVRDFIEQSGDAIGYGRLVLRFWEPDSAMRALSSLLSKSDFRELASSDWTEVLNRLGAPVVPLLLARFDDGGAYVDETVAAALFNLRNHPDIDWEALLKRTDLPIRTRTVCLWGSGKENEPEGEAAVTGFLRDAARTALGGHSPCRAWTGFHEGYVNTEWWRDHLRSIIQDDADAPEVRLAIFDCLTDTSYDIEGGGVAIVDELRALIGSGVNDPTLSAAIFCAASFGDETAEAFALSRLEGSAASDIEAWIAYLPYFSEVHRVAGVERVVKAIRGGANEQNVLEYLLMELGYTAITRKFVAPRGPFQLEIRKSAANDLVFDRVREMTKTDDIGRSSFFARFVDASGEGLAELSTELTDFASLPGHGSNADWSWVFAARNALEHHECPITEDVLFALIAKFPGFPTNSLFEAALKVGGRDASAKIEEIYRSSDEHTRGQIIFGLETISDQLGVMVRRSEAAGIKLEWTSSFS